MKGEIFIKLVHLTKSKTGNKIIGVLLGLIIGFTILWADDNFLTKIRVEADGDLVPVSNYVTIKGDNEVSNLNCLVVGSRLYDPLSFYVYDVYSKVVGNHYVAHISGDLFRQDGPCSMDDYNFHHRQYRIESYKDAYIIANKLLNNNINYTHKFIYTANGEGSSKYPLVRGDQIIEINHVNLSEKNTSDVLKILSSATTKTIPVLVKRGSEYINVDASVIDIGNPIYIVDTIDINGPANYSNENKNTQYDDSSGLMQSLYFYYKLSNKPLPKDLLICGTGSIDLDGNVNQIGDADIKAKAALNRKADIMFVPANVKLKDTNEFDVEKILKGSKTKVIPVRTVKEAIDKLEEVRKGMI